MLARYIRLMLFLELAAYVALGIWLHVAMQWGVAALALAAVAIALGARLAIVCLTTAIALAAGSPRPADQRIGIAATIALLIREWRAFCTNNFFYVPWEEVSLRREVEHIAGATARPKVFLVCHSMGGSPRAPTCAPMAARASRSSSPSRARTTARC